MNDFYKEFNKLDDASKFFLVACKIDVSKIEKVVWHGDLCDIVCSDRNIYSLKKK